VENLCIWNKYGKIKWIDKINVEKIDYKKNVIKINKYNVECRIPELKKLAIIELYNLPKKIKKK
jgi:hypothetical protein